MTGNEIYNKINYRLRSFLGNNLNWKDLNNLQKKAFPIINKQHDVLIISPTASGKTEASLIPVYNDILNEDLPSTSVLYVAPLKALINDMYLRIDQWNKHFGFTASKWHGDVKKSAKDNYISKPTDFLLITPESLEVILINRKNTEKERIFKNIKYIIIDEIHYFADSERGIQLNSLLTRILTYTKNPKIIGLSATLGNPEDVAKWINNEKPATIIENSGKRKIKYEISHYDEYTDIAKYLSKCEEKKILIFVKSRKCVEFYYNLFKKTIKNRNIFLHHASMSKDYKHKNEQSFRKASQGIMISTSTLELGIDIGNIDRVVQISTTNTISSFLQRIGRGGRRTKIQKATIFLNSDYEKIQSLAQINLINKNQIEKINIRREAKDIYLHQILSMIFEEKEIKFINVYETLNKTYSFSEISKNSFKNIIHNLVDKDIIQLNKDKLLLGHAFEKEFGKMNFMNFYSVFPSSTNYKIKKGKKLIGELDYIFTWKLKENDTFILGGKSWTITKMDTNHYTIYVQDGKKTDNIPKWNGSGLMLNYLTSQEIYRILLGNYDQTLLSSADSEIIQTIKKWNNYFKQHNLNEKKIPIVLKKSGKINKIELCTFAGDYVNFLLANILNQKYEIENIHVKSLNLKFSTKEDLSDILSYLKDLKITYNEEFENTISDFSKEKITTKFIEYLPEEEQEDVIKEILFNINDFKELILTSEFIQVDEFNINLLQI